MKKIRIFNNKAVNKKIAVYTFWYEGRFLKIGKAGPNSNARFLSQHYNPKSARSTLAASILMDENMQDIGITENNVGDWIKNNCHRIDILIENSEKTKAIIKNEKDICQLLTDKGYKECFCEIDGGHMKVVVKLKDATSKDANKIIKLIHNKYNGYIIEVKFVED